MGPLQPLDTSPPPEATGSTNNDGNVTTQEDARVSDGGVTETMGETDVEDLGAELIRVRECL